jgi:hypothetical protein
VIVEAWIALKEGVLHSTLYSAKGQRNRGKSHRRFAA